jgi:hypothetical protein
MRSPWETDEMDVERIRRILDSLMILSFLILCVLIGLIVLGKPSLTSKTISLPFIFLFISLTTLAVTGQIDENPSGVNRYLINWLFACVLVVFLGAIVFTLT